MDATWSHISIDAVKNDADLVDQARQNLKYQLYTFANSAVMNVTTEKVATWYDNALSAVKIGSAILTAVCGLGWIVATVLPSKKKGAV